MAVITIAMSGPLSTSSNESVCKAENPQASCTSSLRIDLSCSDEEMDRYYLVINEDSTSSRSFQIAEVSKSIRRWRTGTDPAPVHAFQQHGCATAVMIRSHWEKPKSVFDRAALCRADRRSGLPVGGRQRLAPAIVGSCLRSGRCASAGGALEVGRVGWWVCFDRGLAVCKWGEGLWGHD